MNENIVTAALAVITVSYLLGCFTTGYYLVRLLTGQDIRNTSSGNVGSRNVGRLLGARGFVITLVGDAGKGLLAVWLARQLDPAPWLASAALLAVVVGHIWPLQLRFRGGKGFATFAGGMILLKPLLLLSGLALCAVLYPCVRRTTKTGLIALASSPLFLALERIRGRSALLSSETGIYCLLVLLLLYAHRSNIRKEFFGSSGDNSGISGQKIIENKLDKQVDSA